MLAEQADTRVAVFPMVQVRISGLFSGGFREHAFPDLAGGRRGRLPAADRQPVLDIPAPLALGIYGNIRTGMGGPVQFWLLQHHAHLVSSRPCDDGPVQAENLVRLLPHGHHDTGDLQAEIQEARGNA